MANRNSRFLSFLMSPSLVFKFDLAENSVFRVKNCLLKLTEKVKKKKRTRRSMQEEVGLKALEL